MKTVIELYHNASDLTTLCRRFVHPFGQQIHWRSVEGLTFPWEASKELPDSKDPGSWGINIVELFEQLDINQSRLSEIYIPGKGQDGYSGHFQPNGMQSLSNILQKTVHYFTQPASDPIADQLIGKFHPRTNNPYTK